VPAPADGAPPPPSKPRPKAVPRKKPPRAGIVGPLFRWELVRLARRGQDARARFILAASLFAILTAFTLIWFHNIPPDELFVGTAQEMSLNESAKFADRFATTFLLAQICVLALLTPAYAAGGISEEKEKQTFVFLLASDLTSREILLGKFLGRLVFLLGVMFAGLPILALTQLYGGVSLKFLLVGYLITAGMVTMHAAISVASAAATDTYRGALFRGYGFAALHVIIGGVLPFLSPLFFIALILSPIEPDNPTAFWVLGLGYTAVELVIAFVAVLLGVRWVRLGRARLTRPPREPFDDRPRYRPKTRAVHQPDDVVLLSNSDVDAAADGAAVPTAALAPRPKAAPVIEPPRPRPRRRPPPPPLPDYIQNRPRVWADDPFAWKETYVAGVKRTGDDDNIRGILIAVGVAVALIAAFVIVIGALTALLSGFSGTGASAAEGMLMTVGVAALFVYLLLVGSTAAGSVIRERQRLTLESLLAIPVDRRRILWPKWTTSVTKAWWCGFGAVALPLAFLTTADLMVAVLPTVLLVAAAVPFTASLGLWLSTRCRTLTRAVLWLLSVNGLVVLIPVAARSTFGAREGLLVGVFVGVAGVATALGAWLFWQLALRAFEQEGRR
jgi:ABC-type transport system involved in multi-copper enzyme maturation permease subunit